MRKQNPVVTASCAILSKSPYRLYLRLEGDLPRGLNKIMRGKSFHANYAESNRWKFIVGNAVTLFLPEMPLERYHVQIIRHSVRQLDYDNCVASFKCILDALKDLVILDDSWKSTGAWNVDQRFRSKKEGPVLELWISERQGLGPDQ